MKHSDAQHHLARLSRNLYDDSPEKVAILAASRALSFVHAIACRNGPVSIPVQTLFAQVKIECEPQTVILPPLPPFILKPLGGQADAEADPLDERSPQGDCRNGAAAHSDSDH